MKVSIVVCSYNQSRFVEAALCSLLGQRSIARDELEIIVVDGASTDGTLEILKGYEDRLDVLISEPDAGQTEALAKGFRLATGDVLGWLCSDDVLEEHAIREVIDFFSANLEVQFIYGDALFINADGTVIDVKREIDWNQFVWLHDHNFVRQPAAFWRHELFVAVGGLDTSLHAAMDADLFSRFAQRTMPKHVPRVWARLRMYPGIKTFEMRDVLKKENEKILARFGIQYRSTLHRSLYFAVAKLRRTWLKLSAGCYGDTYMDQMRTLLSMERFLEVFGRIRTSMR